MDKKFRKVENKTIRIFGREVTSKDGKNKFPVYSFTPNGEDFYKVVFTKKCETTPKETGYYLLEVSPNDLSFKKGQVVDGKKYNDTMFIDKVIKMKKDVEYEAKAEQQRFERTMSVLDSVDLGDDTLPWEE